MAQTLVWIFINNLFIHLDEHIETRPTGASLELARKRTPPLPLPSPMAPRRSSRRAAGDEETRPGTHPEYVDSIPAHDDDMEDETDHEAVRRCGVGTSGRRS